MTVALQIREVPEEVRDAIAKRAAEKGQSMQAYLLELVSADARRISIADMFDRAAAHRAKVPIDDEIVRIIREGRDAGEAVDRDEYP
ncbi:MAG TPA: Arc family DNA-binding protein [Propionibacteriaceae bacterium]|nr:Arc family DNA-binding protein [Propionibacteriaceae bacterium]